MLHIQQSRQHKKKDERAKSEQDEPEIQKVEFSHNYELSSRNSSPDLIRDVELDQMKRVKKDPQYNNPT